MDSDCISIHDRIYESAALHYDSCRAQQISRVSALCLICWSVCLYIASESFIEARSRSVWERLPTDLCRIFFTWSSWTAIMCSSRFIESLESRLVSAVEFGSFAERRRSEARRWSRIWLRTDLCGESAMGGPPFSQVTAVGPSKRPSADVCSV